MPVELKSRIPEIVVKAGKRAEDAVSRTCLEVETGAKRHLIEHGSVVTGNLIGSIEAHVEGYEGDVGTAVDYAPYVEYGTGRRGEESEFPGKPEDIAYSPDWPGMTARPYLTPAAEEARAAFENRAAGVFR